jgi:hypothetical protein
MFIKNKTSFIIARFFLGRECFSLEYGRLRTDGRFLPVLESGFIPGGLYTISRWYKKDELACVLLPLPTALRLSCGR